MTTATVSMTFSAPTVQTRLRITRRGRAVLAALVSIPVLVGLALFGVNMSAAAAGDASAVAGDLQYVTVESGQSLWAVAEAIAPSRDPRDVIADIVKMNGLDSANVPAGVSIAIPSYR